MWRYKVFQRDFAMSGVSQEEMDSCVLIIRIYLYKYIYICLVLFVYHIIYISIHTTTCIIHICIYISLYSYIERKVLAWSFCVCRLHHRFEEERSSCHRSCGYLGEHQKGYIPPIFTTILPNLCMSLYESKI